MIRIVLFLLLAIVGYVVFRGALKKPPAVLKKYIRVIGFSVLGGIALYLTATGRLNSFFAFIAVAFASILRFTPALLHYAPAIQRLWANFTAHHQGKSHSRQSDGNSKLSTAEAYEILGLKPGATESDIIAAHRKLILKNHPDRGGSDYLAAKINLAKKTLLKK